MYSFSIDRKDNGEYSYTFNCANGTTYTILFAVAKDLFEFETKEELQFFFLNIIANVDRPAFDSKTSSTIASIIQNFFSNNPEGFLFYYPENNDGRDQTRSRVFERWFDKHSKDVFMRVEYIINIEETIITGGLIYIISNPKKDEGRSIVNRFIKGLNYSKDAF